MIDIRLMPAYQLIVIQTSFIIHLIDQVSVIITSVHLALSLYIWMCSGLVTYQIDEFRINIRYPLINIKLF